MNEPHHLENLTFFRTVTSVVLPRKTIIVGIMIFLSIQANLCAQKYWKRTCPDFGSVTPLEYTILSLYGRKRVNENPYSRIFYELLIWKFRILSCEETHIFTVIKYFMIANFKSICYLFTCSPANSKLQNSCPIVKTQID